MPPPRVSPTEWDRHKTTIRSLYCDENMSLHTLMLTMQEAHGFFATKAQYVRKLKEWQMNKNLPKESWQMAEILTRQRKLQGKESQIIFNGRVVSAKKTRRELARYALLWSTPESLPETNTNFLSEGITIRTPPATPSRFITLAGLPWNQFEESLNVNQAPIIVESDSTHLTQSLVANSKIFPHIDRFAGDEMSRFLCLESLKPLRHDGGFSEGEEPSPIILAHQILKRSIYLCSNNLLRKDQLDAIVDWATTTDECGLLRTALQINGLTTDILAIKVFFSAIRLGKEKLVRDFLQNAMNPNIQEDGLSGTPIQVAAQARSYEMIQLLIDYGADPNSNPCSNNRENPLIVAIGNPGLDVGSAVVQLLLNHGANPNQIDGLETPLIRAVKMKNTEVAELLIKHGADVDQQIPFDGSAVQHAVKQGDLQMLELLILAGAEINVPGPAYLSMCNEVYNHRNVWTSVDAHVLIEHDNNLDLWDTLLSPIQIAARNNQEEMVKMLLEVGANPDALLALQIIPGSSQSGFALTSTLYGVEHGDLATWEYGTALLYAVQNNNSCITNLLLESGADPRASFFGGPTALEIACKAGNLSISTLLIAAGGGIDPMSISKNTDTALQAAIRANEPALIELLLNLGADVNAPPYWHNGRTALQAAAEMGQTDLFIHLQLLGGDASISAAKYQGVTCLQAAASSGDLRLVDIVLSTTKTAHIIGFEGHEALRAAIYTGHTKVFFKLLDAGARIVHHSSQEGDSLLATAVMAQRNDIMSVLLKIGGPDPPGRSTPLCYAIRSMSLGTVKDLVIGRADVDRLSQCPFNDERIDEISYTASPLVMAAHVGDMEIIDILLSAGADVGVSRCDQRSLLPLHEAIRQRHLSIVKRLLISGADPNQQEPLDGCTPLHIATINTGLNDNGEIIKYLINAGADVNLPSCGRYPIENVIGSELHMRILIDSGAKVNINLESSTWTLLEQAIRIGNPDIVRILLENGAEVNAVLEREYGRTALQAAAEKSDLQLVQRLIERGADVNAVPTPIGGATALQLAAINGNFSMVLLLLEHGADINSQGAQIDGRTALEGAAEHGRLDMVHFLLNNDTDDKTIMERSQRAAILAEGRGHLVLAKALRDWKSL